MSSLPTAGGGCLRSRDGTEGMLNPIIQRFHQKDTIGYHLCSSFCNVAFWLSTHDMSQSGTSMASIGGEVSCRSVWSRARTLYFSWLVSVNIELLRSWFITDETSDGFSGETAWFHTYDAMMPTVSALFNIFVFPHVNWISFCFFMN